MSVIHSRKFDPKGKELVSMGDIHLLSPASRSPAGSTETVKRLKARACRSGSEFPDVQPFLV